MTYEQSRVLGKVRSDEVVLPAELLSIRAVAAMLGNCSTRHVRRLSEAGRMPPPVKLGASLRWRRTELVSWIAAGCPSSGRGTGT